MFALCHFHVTCKLLNYCYVGIAIIFDLLLNTKPCTLQSAQGFICIIVS